MLSRAYGGQGGGGRGAVATAIGVDTLIGHRGGVCRVVVVCVDGQDSSWFPRDCGIVSRSPQEPGQNNNSKHDKLGTKSP